MQQYKTFSFDGFACSPETGKIELKYSLQDAEDGGFGMIDFVETLTFTPVEYLPMHKEEELKRALFLLHMIGGISYFKTCLPKNIVIKSGQLSAADAEFWKKVYENGLGEFFYKNKIDYRDLIAFPSTDAVKERKPAAAEERKSRSALVPIGGGKDSVVTIELLKKAKIPATLLRIGSHPLITSQAKTAGLPLFEVKRGLSPRLFELNAEGALNGHVPITAYLSFLSVVLAILRGDEAVVFSNERSANEGNVEYLGMEINHQWSKSLEFERMLQHQVGQATSIKIFSLLRPYSELSIAHMFSKFDWYFPYVTSCNENWKLFAKSEKVSAGKLWCGKCPKCAFVFALLHASMPHAKVSGMFGADLFTDESLLPLYRELLGLEGFKPFECVGTTDETKAAFLISHEKGDSEKTLAMKMFVAECLPGIGNPKKLVADVQETGKEHAIPTSFIEALP